MEEEPSVDIVLLVRVLEELPERKRPRFWLVPSVDMLLLVILLLEEPETRTRPKFSFGP